MVRDPSGEAPGTHGSVTRSCRLVADSLGPVCSLAVLHICAPAVGLWHLLLHPGLCTFCSRRSLSSPFLPSPQSGVPCTRDQGAPWFPFSLCVSQGRPSPESQHLRAALSVAAFGRWCTKHTDEYCSKNSFILTSHLQSGFFSWHHLGAISSSPPCSSHVCPPHFWAKSVVFRTLS